jgi:Sec-independent protein translocase protein TatA
MTMPGIWELIIIGLILVALLGGGKAMGAIKDLGKEVYGLKRKLDDLEDIKKGKF